MTDEEVLELRLPPTAAFNSTARLFVGAAGRHFALGEEVLADLRVAVSEVCTEAMEVSPRPDLVSIVIRARADALDVEVEGQRDPGGTIGSRAGDYTDPEPNPAEAQMARTMRGPLLAALFPDATYDPTQPRLLLSVPWDA